MNKIQLRILWVAVVFLTLMNGDKIVLWLQRGYISNDDFWRFLLLLVVWTAILVYTFRNKPKSESKSSDIVNRKQK
jgi:hypothetical protein